MKEKERGKKERAIEKRCTHTIIYREKRERERAGVEERKISRNKERKGERPIERMGER